MGTPLTSSFRVSPLEIPTLEFGVCGPSACTLEAYLISPSTNAVCVTRVPPVIRRDRPLDIELDIRGHHPDSYAAATVAHSFSVHANFVAILEGQAQSSSFTAQVSVFPSGERWIARVLTPPSSWDNAELANVSITLGQQSLPCEVLQATIRVGYNHASAPAGAVLAAAKAGDGPALQAALDAGGSTEEADSHVRHAGKCVGLCYAVAAPVVTLLYVHVYRMDAQQCTGQPQTATSTSSVHSWQQAQILLPQAR